MFQPFSYRTGSTDAFKVVSGGSRSSFVTFTAGKAMSLAPYTSFVGDWGCFLLVGKGRMDDDLSLCFLFSSSCISFPHVKNTATHKLPVPWAWHEAGLEVRAKWEIIYMRLIVTSRNEATRNTCISPDREGAWGTGNWELALLQERPGLWRPLRPATHQINEMGPRRGAELTLVLATVRVVLFSLTPEKLLH